ncbi:MAG: PAS domain S-box protein [Desulfotignum sp.]|nr:PAS domain S-box protein [Desulfotignum sp.]MCF8138399.1 PAS domain S-box protein [Desulfotignum sp.]
MNKKARVQPSDWWLVLGFSLLLLVLVLVSRINFLIFHTLAEIFSILVAWSLFVILWNTKNLIENKALVFVGIAYLFVGGIDLVHMLSYSGMGFLEPERGADPATQLWILARYVESISLCLFPFLFFRQINPYRVFAVFSFITVAGLMSILYWGIFPACYMDGFGLTAFKKISEYIICGILVAALVFLRQKKADLDSQVYPYMVAAIVFTICAEIAFTFYVSVYGLSNLIGHFFKIISFYCIYLALIRVGLTQPHSTLFNRLEQSEAQFRAMFEEHSAVMLLIDPRAGRILNANKAAAHYYGYSLKQLLEMNIHQLNQLSPEEVAHQMQQAVTRQTTRFEFQHLLADGKIRDVEVHSTPMMLNGRMILFSIVNDITEQKQAREALREHWRKLDETVEALQSQTDLLEGVLDSIRDVIGVQLPDHTVVKYNRAGYRLLGLTEEAVAGKKCYELLGKVNPCHICPTAKALVSKKMETIEKHIPEFDGYFICTSNPILDDTGEIKLIIEQLTDITEKKKMDENIRQAQKLEAIGTLAGGIAHDFNNILFSIIGNADLLLDDFPEGSPCRKSLVQIHTGALRAKALVHQILAFARQEENKRTMMKMQPIIKEALTLLRSTIPTTIAFTRDIQPDCGPVQTDPNQVHQIVMNLATNAYHAMEENGGELKVILKEVELDCHELSDPDMAPGQYACLTVSDTGTGMNKDVMNKMFDPFFTTKEKGKGTGMGLSVVHGIVKSMNGTIRVDSEPGYGTAFHVFLPIVQKAFDSQPEGLKSPVPGGNERILLVDDEEAIVGMEKQVLTRLGYDVTSRTSSVEALEAFRNHPDRFDLVITDMTMPEMPGDKLVAEMIAIRPDIPILLCTGFSHTLTDEKITSLGIKDMLMKPVLIKELALKIREVLKR